MLISKSIIDRFFNYTKQNENGCLEWTASVTQTRGYGRFYLNGKTVSAHRVAWIIKYGQIPNDLNVCHSCDNKICVNWKHLWLGTHQHNAKDRDLKGRHNRRSRDLSQDQENEIANLYYTTDITQTELSKKFNITRSLVNRTVRFTHFKDKYGKKRLIKPKKITSTMREEIIKQYSQGETTENLAKFYNVTPGAIQWHLKIKNYRSNHNKNQRIRRSKFRL